MYIISGCLLGYKCKYSGGDNYNEVVELFAQKHSHLPVCPEVAGGLKVPRIPAEIVGDRVVNKEGIDVTKEFSEGSSMAYNAAVVTAIERQEPICGAILKSKSPTCGCGMVYDGTFTGNLIEGDGIFTRLLKEKGIRVVTEEDSLEKLK